MNLILRVRFLRILLERASTQHRALGLAEGPTMLNRHGLVSQLREALKEYSEWRAIFSAANKTPFALHLAIFREPYLEFIMQGRKTVETRFARRACAPFESVFSGDVVMLKRSGGGIVGICLVEKVWFYRLTEEDLPFIRERFGAAICPENDSFWEERREAAVATLMSISKVTRLDNIDVPKRDRRGWVVLDPGVTRRVSEDGKQYRLRG